MLGQALLESFWSAQGKDGICRIARLRLEAAVEYEEYLHKTRGVIGDLVGLVLDSNKYKEQLVSLVSYLVIDILLF